MKKSIFLIVFVLMCISARAQEWKANKRGVTIEYTIPCPNVNASTCYNRALEYVDQTYVDANNVTKSSDATSGSIIVSGYYPGISQTRKVTDWGIPCTIPLGKLDVDAHHHLKFTCTDNQVVVRINVDFYEICRDNEYRLKVNANQAAPFGQLTEEDHKKYKLINKAFSSDDHIFQALQKEVQEEMANLKEILNGEF